MAIMGLGQSCDPCELGLPGGAFCLFLNDRVRRPGAVKYEECRYAKDANDSKNEEQ
jgi:hypothetical protein